MRQNQPAWDVSCGAMETGLTRLRFGPFCRLVPNLNAGMLLPSNVLIISVKHFCLGHKNSILPGLLSVVSLIRLTFTQSSCLFKQVKLRLLFSIGVGL